MATFTGSDVRELRKAHKLSRQELGAILGVAAVTVEKWEQSSDRAIRSKYHEKLMHLGGAGVAGVGAGLLAAPALLPIAGLIGIGAVGAAAILSDRELDQAAATIEKLRRLSPDERETMIRLLKKANGESGPGTPEA